MNLLEFSLYTGATEHQASATHENSSWEESLGQEWGREECFPHQYSRLLGSTLAEVKNLPWVEIPHEGLDDLGSL